MIRELRRRHRLVVTLLAVVTPAIFLAAITGRTAMPAPGLPPGFLPERPRDWSESAPSGLSQ